MHTVYALKHVYVPARNFGSNLESAVTFCAICVVFDLSCEKYVWFPNQSVEKKRKVEKISLQTKIEIIQEVAKANKVLKFLISITFVLTVTILFKYE